MDRVNDRIGRRREEAIDQMGPGIGFDFVPRSPLNSVHMPAKTKSGRFSLSANQTDIFLAALRIPVWRKFREAIRWNQEPSSGSPASTTLASEVRLCCGYLTRGSRAARGGGGMPQRIMVNSRSAPASRTTGAGKSG
jgi:hypothetical protein